MSQTNKFKWTDVHTHLHMLNIPPQQAVQAATDNGVDNMITIGTEPKDWSQVIQHAQNFPNVQGALGLHPHYAKLYNNTVEAQLRKNLEEKDITVCGEIGLDYYYEHSDRIQQQKAFRQQMTLAAEKKMPVEIHTRSAEEDTKTILKEFKGQVRGLLHCFTGSWSLAKSALDLGFHISFSGIISFKNTEDLRETCQKVPLNALHLETDAPYLAPVPYRGKTNQPAWLIHTAEVVAQLKNISLEELSDTTQKNYRALFS